MLRLIKGLYHLHPFLIKDLSDACCWDYSYFRQFLELILYANPSIDDIYAVDRALQLEVDADIDYQYIRC